MKARGPQNNVFKCRKKNNSQPSKLSPVKRSFENKLKIKLFFIVKDKRKQNLWEDNENVAESGKNALFNRKCWIL